MSMEGYYLGRADLGLRPIHHLLTSFSSHFLSGVTYGGAIQQNPWPESTILLADSHRPALRALTTHDPVHLDPFGSVRIHGIPTPL